MCPPRAEGRACGERNVTLDATKIGHGHALINRGAVVQASKTSAPLPSSSLGGIQMNVGGGILAPLNSFVSTGKPDTAMHPGMIGMTGSDKPEPHDNSPPYLAMLYCICLQGEYPAPD